MAGLSPGGGGKGQVAEGAALPPDGRVGGGRGALGPAGRRRGLRWAAISARQIISALEEDPVGQKMQLACRLQQIAALVENKVTDL